MPKHRPSTSGYARLLQAEEEDPFHDEYEDDDPYQVPLSMSKSESHYSPPQPRRDFPRMHSYQATRSSHTHNGDKTNRPSRLKRGASTVDIKAINARLERWAEEIASKFKLRKSKGKSLEEEKLEIHYSVFQAPEDIRPATAETLVERFSDEAEDRMTKMQFDDVVESIKVAIEMGTQPTLITQGSSGSYFARNTQGTIVGVFKPKDEEPYASKNPKWTKWFHRNFFPFFFGRACLIPNLSYVSEAAAYVLDARLRTNIVPYTDVIYLSSPSFHYGYWDRRGYYRKGKELPPKVGSLQVFLKGFQDATKFLKAHPWPDQVSSNLSTDTTRQKKGRGWADECRVGGTSSDDSDSSEDRRSRKSELNRLGFWTDALRQSFREELEKLVILDYIMRNTDRGLDNWMIRIDEETQQATIVAEAPKRSDGLAVDDCYFSQPHKRDEPMTLSGSTTPNPSEATVRLGAIDNSLSWPWKHPDAWRSFPFGWLFLPVSLIGQPFSEKTRKHFLPLLTSKQWWSETQLALRKCFMQDSDFQEKMFAKQIAVMKGQAWNVVETLKLDDHGPLELTRRSRVLVWDDLIDIPVALPMRPSTDSTRRALGIGQSNHSHHHQVNGNTLLSSDPEQPHTALDPIQESDQASPSSFHLSRQGSSEHVGRDSEDGDISLFLPNDNRQGSGHLKIDTAEAEQLLKHSRPTTRRARTRLSFDEPRARWQDEHPRKRTYSFTTRRLIDEVDEDDGDLGFAAAREQEGNRRKVIVERLETVKTKAPFFTWC